MDKHKILTSSMMVFRNNHSLIEVTNHDHVRDQLILQKHNYYYKFRFLDEREGKFTPDYYLK